MHEFDVQVRRRVHKLSVSILTDTDVLLTHDGTAVNKNVRSSVSVVTFLKRLGMTATVELLFVVVVVAYTAAAALLQLTATATTVLPTTAGFCSSYRIHKSTAYTSIAKTFNTVKARQLLIISKHALSILPKKK